MENLIYNQEQTCSAAQIEQVYSWLYIKGWSEMSIYFVFYISGMVGLARALYRRLLPC